MARVEMEIKDKRLNIAETLKQATMALETHRAWMKRRVSSSITPLDGNEAVVVGDVTESNPKMVNVACCLGRKTPHPQRGDIYPSRVSPIDARSALHKLLLHTSSSSRPNTT